VKSKASLRQQHGWDQTQEDGHECQNLSSQQATQALDFVVQCRQQEIALEINRWSCQRHDNGNQVQEYVSVRFK
jgi:hypothetical protein